MRLCLSAWRAQLVNMDGWMKPAKKICSTISEGLKQSVTAMHTDTNTALYILKYQGATRPLF